MTEFLVGLGILSAVIIASHLAALALAFTIVRMIYGPEIPTEILSVEYWRDRTTTEAKVRIKIAKDRAYLQSLLDGTLNSPDRSPLNREPPNDQRPQAD